MKGRWKSVQLADAVEAILTGPFGSALHQADYSEDGVPLVNPANIVDERISSIGIKRVGFRKAETLSGYALRTGDIVIGRRGEIGRCAVVSDDQVGWLCGTGSFIIRPGETFDSNFLAMMIRSPACIAELERAASGATMLNLSNQSLGQLRVIWPPLEEQRRIVTVLDEAFAAIAIATANAEKNLANARDLFSAIFAQALAEPGPGWSIVKIESIASLISGQHIDASDYNSERRGIGYLTGPSDFGERSPIVTKWTEHPKRTALRGDILITVKGSGVGSVNVMSDEELAISRQLMAVRVNATDPELVFFALEAGFEHFQKIATGAAIPGISRTDVLEFKIALPPQNELQNFMSRLQHLRASAAQIADGYCQKISSLTALRQSLLHRAFTGELTATAPDLVPA